MNGELLSYTYKRYLDFSQQVANLYCLSLKKNFLRMEYFIPIKYNLIYNG